MICIIKRNEENEIVGWITATDLHDARRQAGAVGENDLASLLYTRDELPPPGQHELPVNPWGMPRYTMLVS